MIRYYYQCSYEYGEIPCLSLNMISNFLLVHDQQQSELRQRQQFESTTLPGSNLVDGRLPTKLCIHEYNHKIIENEH